MQIQQDSFQEIVTREVGRLADMLTRLGKTPREVGEILKAKHSVIMRNAWIEANAQQGV